MVGRPASSRAAWISPGRTTRRSSATLDVLEGRVVPGEGRQCRRRRHGFDVAEIPSSIRPVAQPLDPARWMAEWGIDPAFGFPGGPGQPQPERPARQAHCCSAARKPGAKLGQDHWLDPSRGAQGQGEDAGVEYPGADDAGFRIRVDGEEQLLPVDHVGSAPGRNRGGSRSTSCARPCPTSKSHLIGGAGALPPSLMPSAPSTVARAWRHAQAIVAGNPNPGLEAKPKRIRYFLNPFSLRSVFPTLPLAYFCSGSELRTHGPFCDVTPG